VYFDKTRQNVDQLGIVDFLSKEPARTAAAVPKCFYFQSDHWRASIVQSNGASELYEWQGHYFFDKARGAGGAWVTNFNINGHTGDPSAVPGIPQQYARYLGPGTGGIVAYSTIPGDPRCVAEAAAHPSAIYAKPYAAPSAAPPPLGCAPVRGVVSSRALGLLALGDPERRVRGLLGPPVEVRAGFLRYCLTDGSSYLVGEPDASSDTAVGEADAPTVLLMTTSRAYRMHGIGPGVSARVLRRRLRRARLVLHGGTSVWALRRGVGTLFGVRRGRVAYVVVYDRRSIATRARLADFLRRAG
jgi:hypothetical protein